LPEHSRWREQVVLEESGLDPGHSEGDWFNVICCQSVAPCKFNVPDIEGILVLDEGKALAWAGAFVWRQKEHVGTVLGDLNVRDVEFARGYRLTTNYIEPISFTVPRVKSTFFQDDLFPPTRVLWQASCSGARWLAGELGAALWVSLRPHDMPALSNGMSSTKPAAIKKASTTTTMTSSGLNREEADNMGKGLKDSVSRILGTTHSLEQDCMEGVEDKDWEEEE
jgi:hypothetical protein